MFELLCVLADAIVRRSAGMARPVAPALAAAAWHTRLRVLLESGRDRRMSEHDGYLDRMTVRLNSFEAELQAWSNWMDESQLRDLRAGLRLRPSACRPCAEQARISAWR